MLMRSPALLLSRYYRILLSVSTSQRRQVIANVAIWEGKQGTCILWYGQIFLHIMTTCTSRIIRPVCGKCSGIFHACANSGDQAKCNVANHEERLVLAASYSLRCEKQQLDWCFSERLDIILVLCTMFDFAMSLLLWDVTGQTGGSWWKVLW